MRSRSSIHRRQAPFLVCLNIEKRPSSDDRAARCNSLNRGQSERRSIAVYDKLRASFFSSANKKTGHSSWPSLNTRRAMLTGLWSLVKSVLKTELGESKTVAERALLPPLSQGPIRASASVSRSRLERVRACRQFIRSHIRGRAIKIWVSESTG